MITCTRKIEFDAGHRLMNHESKCRYVHGHRYIIEATFTAPELDRVGRVIDFAAIKEKLWNWIENNWDHTIILYKQDKELGDAIENHTGQKIYYMPTNPTAENMADYLLNAICPKLFNNEQDLTCTRLRLWETPNCYAEVR